MWKKTNLRIEYYDKGKGNAVVFIHGMCVDSHNYIKLLDILAKDFRVIAPILPGHGKSPYKGEDMKGCADMLCEFISARKLKKFYLVGFSMGGLLAQLVASKTKVKGLVIIDSAGIPQKDLPAVLFLKMLIGETLHLRSFRMLGIAMSDIILWVKVGARIIFNKRFRSFLFSTLDEYRLDIRCRTLILWGKKDPVLHVEDAYKFGNRIKGSKVKVFEGYSHHWIRYYPESFCSVFAEWVKQSCNNMELTSKQTRFTRNIY